MSDLLTVDELRALDLTAELVNLLAIIVGDNPRTAAADLDEFAVQIHGIQHTIMSQAAARAYPERFRLLGGVVNSGGEAS